MRADSRNLSQRVSQLHRAGEAGGTKVSSSGELLPGGGCQGKGLFQPGLVGIVALLPHTTWVALGQFLHLSEPLLSIRAPKRILRRKK